MNKVIRYLKKSSPTILSFVGISGVVGTAVLAAKAAPKADKEIRKYKKTKDEPPTKAEVFKIAAPFYIPTVITGTATILCIFGANVLSKRNQASLVSAYALMSDRYQKYRDSAKKVYGPNADFDIMAQTAKDVYVSADGYSIYPKDFDLEEENLLFYDDISKRYFQTTMASVINAQYHLNRNFALRGYVDINEFYEFLGIDKIEGGDDIGWEFDNVAEAGYQWLDFENSKMELEDGLVCYMIAPLLNPLALFYQDEAN